MGERIIDPKFNIQEVYRTMNILNPYRFGGGGGSLLLDQYPNAFGWSLDRQLRSTYTGAIRRVKAGGIEQDIGSVNGKVDSATLQTFANGGDALDVKVYCQGNNAIDLASINPSTAADTGALVTLKSGFYGTKAIDSIISVKSETGLNGGAILANASFFMVYKNSAAATVLRPGGFGDYLQGGSVTKENWNIDSDNSLRFDGGALTANKVPATTGLKIRSSFKNGDVYSDYINGQENISPTVLTGTNIADDFFLFPHNSNGELVVAEVIVFLSDESANRQAIEAELNAHYQIF